MSRLLFTLAASLVAPCLAAGPALAGGLTASELSTDGQILSAYNLVDFGAYSAGNETEGPIVVGGTMAGGGHNAGFNGHQADPVIGGVTYGDVTVFGNVTGGFNPGGNTYIGGTSSGTFLNLGGASFNVVGSSSGTLVSGAGSVNTAQPAFLGTAQNTQSRDVHAGLPAASVFPFSGIAAFQAPLSDLSAALGALPGLAGVSPQALPNPPGGNLTLTAHSDATLGGRHYGVVTTTYDNLAGENNFFGIDDNGQAATIVVVTGNDAGKALPNLNGNNDESHVIWDFVDATTLRFQGGWYGTILAPKATITQQGGDLTGPVVVDGFTQSNELHLNYAFSGDLSGLGASGGLLGDPGGIGGGATSDSVPEPAAFALLGVGLAGIAAARRRV